MREPREDDLHTLEAAVAAVGTRDSAKVWKELTGPRLRLFPACRAAIVQGRADLLDQCQRELPELVPDQRGADTRRRALATVLLVAQGVYCLTREHPELETAVERLWEATGRRDGGRIPPAPASIPPWEGTAAAWLSACLKAFCEVGVDSSLGHLWELGVFLLTGQWPQGNGIPVQMRVVFVVGGRGVLATLSLRRQESGLSGLSPDPRTMLFAHTERAFTDALRQAWDYTCAYAPSAPPGHISWGLVDHGFWWNERPLEGPSLCGAFKVGLRCALDPTLPRADLGYVISAGFDTEHPERLASVGGLAELQPKLEVCRQEGVTLVVGPEDVESEVNQLGHPHPPHLEIAATVQEALDKVSGLWKRVVTYLDGMIQELEESMPFKPPSGRFDFQKLHIQVKVSERRRDPWIVRERENALAGGESLTLFERLYAHRSGEDAFEEQRERPFLWDENAAQRHRRAVILGDPGLGKTTLLKAEATRVARNGLQALRRQEASLKDIEVPIYLPLPSLAHPRKEHEHEIAKALAEHDGALWIQEALATLATQNKPWRWLRSWLSERLQAGRCVILLDALDEVNDPGRRTQLEGRLQPLSHSPLLWNNRLYISSRIVGYDQAPIAPMQELELVAFNLKQINAFLDAWFGDARDREGEYIVNHLAQELRQDLRRQGLAQTPLLLTLMCEAYQHGGLKLPTRRVDLYRECLKGMLGKWPQKKRKSVDEGWVDAKLELLEHLALEFEGREVLPVRELRERITDYLKALDLSHDLKGRKPQVLVRQLSEGDGILNRTGGSSETRYFFLHRTFQEYLTARALAQKAATDQAQLEVWLQQHLYKSEWQEVLGLLGGTLADTHADLAPWYTRKLVDQCRGDLLMRPLGLACRALGEAGDEVCGELARNLAGYLMQIFRPLISRELTLIISENRFLMWMRDLPPGVVRSIVQAFTKNPLPTRTIAWVMRIIGGTSAMETLISLLRREQSHGAREAIIEALVDLGDPRAVPTLVKLLENGRNEQAIIRALGRIGDRRVMPILLELLKAKRPSDIIEPGAKLEALMSLFRLVTGKEMFALGRWLRRYRPYGLHYYRTFLEQFAGLISLDQSLKALESENNDVQCSAARVLGMLRAREARAPLLKLLLTEDEDSFARAAAADALGRIGDRRVVAPLLKLLLTEDEDSSVRAATADALGDLKDRRVVAPLLKLLRNQETPVDVQETIVQALGKLRAQGAVDALLERLQKRDEDANLQAVDSWRKRGDIREFPEESLHLLDEEHLKERVAWALGEIGDRKAVPVLVRQLAKRYPPLGEDFMDAMAKIGDLNDAPILIEAFESSGNHWLKEALYRIALRADQGVRPPTNGAVHRQHATLCHRLMTVLP